MRLTLLRHGRTAANAEGRFNRPDDPLLADEAAWLAGRRLEGDFDAVFVSPQRRCLETAAALGLGDTITEPRIVERHFGCFAGLTAAECAEQYPQEFAAFRRFDADYAPPGGESRAANFERIGEWLIEASRFDSVLAVTHGGTIDCVYRQAAGLPLHGGTTIHAGRNATLTIVSVALPDLRLIDHEVPLA